MTKINCDEKECDFCENGVCTAEEITMEAVLDGPEACSHSMACDPYYAKRVADKKTEEGT